MQAKQQENKYSLISLAKSNQGTNNCTRKQFYFLDQCNGVIDLTLFISAV